MKPQRVQIEVILAMRGPVGLHRLLVGPEPGEAVFWTEFMVQDHTVASLFAAVGILIGAIGGLEVEDEKHTKLLSEHQTLVVWLIASTIACLVLCDWDTHINVAHALRTCFSSSEAHVERLRLPVEPFLVRVVVQKPREAAFHGCTVFVTVMEYCATYGRLDPWIFKAAQINHKAYLPLLGNDAVEHRIGRVDRCLSVMFGRHREFCFLVGDMLDFFTG